jgi:hypothetical protein
MQDPATAMPIVANATLIVDTLKALRAFRSANIIRL